MLLVRLVVTLGWFEFLYKQGFFYLAVLHNVYHRLVCFFSYKTLMAEEQDLESPTAALAILKRLLLIMSYVLPSQIQLGI